MINFIITFIETLFNHPELLQLVCLCVCSVKLVLPWCEVSRLERSSSVLLTECIRVCVLGEDHYFSMFLRLQHTYQLMQQLADYAVARLFDKEQYDSLHPLRDPLHITQRCHTTLHNAVVHRTRSETRYTTLATLYWALLCTAPYTLFVYEV